MNLDREPKKQVYNYKNEIVWVNLDHLPQNDWQFNWALTE